MTDSQGNEMDWFYQRYQKDKMSHSFARSRLLIIFSTMLITLTLFPVLRMLGTEIYVFVSGDYMSGHHSVLLINCPTEQTAKDISRHIMEKRMAACVNILPRTSTMYYWKGEIQDTSEILLLVRTRTSVIQKLTDYVKTIHPYDIPEILSFPVEGGSLSYLKWMDEAVPEV
ncbi:protein CutA homolog isoform X1 [Brachyhypopomus gauderio]|uniref:protein CutA homolog isoform X1 n=1 Tax=Brachyhypopomus gauderio TaxID=698409 RepID=UPI0040427C4E